MCLYMDIYSGSFLLVCNSTPNLIGSSVSYPSNPSSIRLCGSPLLRPQHEKPVDTLDTRNTIH